MNMKSRQFVARPVFRMMALCLGFICMLLAMHFWLEIPIQSPVFTIIGLTGGWLVNLLAGRWNAQASRLDDARLTAYRDINAALSTATLEMSRLGQELRNWESSLDWWNDPHLQAIVKWQTLPDQFQKEWERSQDSYLKFLVAFKSAALLFWDLEKLRLVLFEENMTLGGEWSDFSSFLRTEVTINPRGPKDAKHVAVLRARAQAMSTRLFDVSTYLHDFGVALQNHTMGPLAGFDLPPRKPEPPHKTLENIAATSSLGLRPQGKSAGAVSVQKDNVSVAKEYAVVKETA